MFQDGLPVALIVSSDSGCLNWRRGYKYLLFSKNQQVVTNAAWSYSTSFIVPQVTGGNDVDVNEGLGITGDLHGFHYQLTESILV